MNEKYLVETEFFDFSSEQIFGLIKEFKTQALSEKEKAIGLYLKIRDGWRYDPYKISFRENDYKASVMAGRPTGHCIDKAVLYIAGLRGLGIPARLSLAKVKNHIAVEKLIEKVGTNELTPHGSVDVFLAGKWVKATPAFNKELCEKCNVEPLAFDGEIDSLFQEYSKSGEELFMEYIEDYGTFEDLPFDFIIQNMKDNYPGLAKYFKKDAIVNL